MCIPWPHPGDRKVGHLPVPCSAQPFGAWLGGLVTHFPSPHVIVIPAAKAEAKPTHASDCLGSTLLINIASCKVITDPPTLRNSKASVFFVDLTVQIKTGFRGVSSTGAPNRSSFPSPMSLVASPTHAAESKIMYTTRCQSKTIFLRGFLMSLLYAETLGAPAC